MPFLVPLQTFQNTGGGSGDTTPPTAPLLTLVVAGNAQISFHYTAPVDADYDSGEIEYDNGVNVVAFPVTVTGAYTITGLQNGTPYRLTARAADADGNWSSRSLARFAMPFALVEGNKWARWISESVFKHIETQIAGRYPLYFEGDNRRTNNFGDFLEVRIDNPIFRQCTPTLWHLESRLDILIQHSKSKDLFAIERAIGIIISCLPTSIPIMMYEDTDPIELLGCMDRISDHKVHRFGNVREKTHLSLAAVEVLYQLEVET